MKLRSMSIMLLAVLLIPALTACGSRNSNNQLNSKEELIEDRLDAAEDRLEDQLESQRQENVTNSTTQNQADNANNSVNNNTNSVDSNNTSANDNNASVSDNTTSETGKSRIQNNAAVTTTITREEAEAIALTHAGLTGTEVSGLYTELDLDDSIYKYEVQFYYDVWEYEYDINAETGDIISFDKDKELLR